MPKADLKKTKSEPSRETNPTRFFSIRWAQNKFVRGLFFALLIIVSVMALLSPALFYKTPTAHLVVGGQTVLLEIARTQAQQEKGLGGRNHMSADRGMLFVLDRPTKQCFWMKDMRFSLDMAWLDTERKVVFVQADVSPRTYPAAFCPDSTAKYVVELSAGQLAKLGVHTGQILKF